MIFQWFLGSNLLRILDRSVVAFGFNIAFSVFDYLAQLNYSATHRKVTQELERKRHNLLASFGVNTIAKVGQHQPTLDHGDRIAAFHEGQEDYLRLAFNRRLPELMSKWEKTTDVGLLDFHEYLLKVLEFGQPALRRLLLNPMVLVRIP